MQITEILDNNKNKYLRNVFLDNGTCLTLPVYLLQKRHMKQGNQLEDEEIEQLKETIIRPKIRKKTLDYLSKRVYGIKELQDKLTAFGFLEEDIIPVIEKYISLGYLNDADFACRYVHDALILKKMPQKRIRYDLLRKGVDENLIEEAFFEFDGQEYENLVYLIEKKMRCAKDDSKETLQKIKMQFYRKGYPLREIEKAMQAFLEKEF